MPRRIYDSEALSRDSEDPFVPNDVERGPRSVDWSKFSHAFVPTDLRYRAIEVTVETNRDRYERGEPVDVRVTFRNRVPFPIVLRTESAVRWFWAVDGHVDASTIPVSVPDTGKRLFTFGRSETKTFLRRWDQAFKVDRHEWAAVEPGEYTISTWINVPDAAVDRVADETTVRID